MELDLRERILSGLFAKHLLEFMKFMVPDLIELQNLAKQAL